MSTFSLSAWLTQLATSWPLYHLPTVPLSRPPLSDLAQLDDHHLPTFVRESEVALKYLRLLGPLDWSHFPDRPDQRFAPNDPPLPWAAFVAAYLVKLDQHLPYLADLHAYLVEHPALVWVLGFPLVPSSAFSWGFDVAASLPTHRHFCRLLRDLPDVCGAYLLDETVRLIRLALLSVAPDFGDCVSVDTKHILAWVKQNNPKAYVKDRFDKTQPPSGDPDCRLGCKRKHNQHKGHPTVEDWPTPTQDPRPAVGLKIGEYYWGYASGIVATKVGDWAEVVLAELTQPFDQSDASYFHPLMTQVERRLGRRPRCGAFDAAFDAFYVYEFFADAGGFAAVPFVDKGGQGQRLFSPEGLPLCSAGLAMPLRYTFQCKTTLIPHQRGKYVCPLLFPTPTDEVCPIADKHWAKGGCATTLATSRGARLRYQIDRDTPQYKAVYRQRTATERIHSQAVALGIERPKLRNGLSIAHHNTLTYVLINLHALQRIHRRLAKGSPASSAAESVR